MADVKKCDRCGKFFDHSTSGEFEGRILVTFNFSEYWEKRYNVYDIMKGKKDLCKECADKLEAWMETGEDL